jgi:peptidylprolyl isomerase
MTRSRPLTLIAALASLALLPAACGSDDEAASTKPAATETAAPTETPAPTASLTDTSQKPAIAKPSGAPPAKLLKKDIVKGSGATARAGDQVTVQYVGVSHSTGEQFDASWDSGQPFDFALGEGAVIPGWDEGVAGMKVGGRRQLTIPPDLAYGAQGAPPTIGPNETLVFVIDLLKVQKG